MGLAMLVLVGAVAVAWLTGGTFGHLAAFPMRGRWLVVLAVVAQLVGGLLATVRSVPDAYLTGLAVSAAAAGAFCLRNLRLAGLPLVCLGLTANALVVGCNGDMPVSAHAAARADVAVTSIAAGSDPRHDIAGRTTTLRWLGDVVPIALPLRPEVASPGDLLVSAGLAELVVVGMRGRWRRRRAGGRRRVVACT
jgi:hypothetical protein